MLAISQAYKKRAHPVEDFLNPSLIACSELGFELLMETGEDTPCRESVGLNTFSHTASHGPLAKAMDALPASERCFRVFSLADRVSKGTRG